MVSDDIVHAYGSMGHKNVLHTLLSTGIYPSVASLMVESARQIRIYYGGATTEGMLQTKFDSGTGQGDPWSTVIFCVAYELRGSLVVRTHQGVASPWGSVLHLVLSDDAQYPCDGPDGVEACLKAPEKATRRSDPLKTIVAGVSRKRFVSKAIQGEFYLIGVPQKVAGQGKCVRVRGRHALPHVFHSQAFAKPLRTVRIGVRVLRVRLLPAMHTVTIAVAKVRGGCEWFGLVHPPATLTVDVFDLPLVSTLRIVGNRGMCPVCVCFEDGLFGVSSASVYISTAFLVTHIRQVNHPNRLVSSSSRHMVVKYAWRFSPHMPCLASHAECDSHRDDHSRRLRLWHELGWAIHVPVWWCQLAEPHPMGFSVSQREVSDVHAWMCLGLTKAEATQARHWMVRERDDSDLPTMLGVSEPFDDFGSPRRGSLGDPA